MSERLLHINGIGGCVGISQPEGMPDKIGIRLTLPLELFTITSEAVQDAIAVAVAAEREAIVKMIEALSNDFDPYSATAQGACDTISDAIRARGKE